MERLDAGAVAQIEAFLEHWAAAGLAAESVLKAIREVGEQQGWEWLVGGKRAEFNRRCIYLARAFSYARHSDGRRGQLVEGNFAYWVLRADPDCPGSHQAIDGLALPPDHAFWAYDYPPLDPECGCYVVGAGTASGVARLGGDLGISPPSVQLSSPLLGVEELLLAIRNGDAPPADPDG